MEDRIYELYMVLDTDSSLIPRDPMNKWFPQYPVLNFEITQLKVNQKEEQKRAKKAYITYGIQIKKYILKKLGILWRRKGDGRWKYN